jgi:hypothetical protein
MSENLLVPLPGFMLPADFPWRVRFIAAVDEQLRRLRATGHYVPARFFGYYFHGATPMGVSGSWTVALDLAAPWRQVNASLERLTCGQFSIASEARGVDPDFMLVHDRFDGACWLWRFGFGLRFVEATEPVAGADRDDGGSYGGELGDRRLLGP